MTIRTSYKKYKRQQAKFSQNKVYARKKSSRQKKKKSSSRTGRASKLTKVYNTTRWNSKMYEVSYWVRGKKAPSPTGT